MAKFRHGDLVLTSTQKIIQGSKTLLDADAAVAIDSLIIDGTEEITSVTNDHDLLGNSPNVLATEEAIVSYVATHGGGGGSGTSGTSGSSGDTGVSGTSGSSGTSGTNGTTVLTGGYTHTQLVDSTAWHVVHNLNSQFVNVEVIDSNNKAIIPGEIIFTDSSSLMILFEFGESGFVNVASGGGGTSGSSGQSGSSGTSGVGGKYIYTQTNDSTSWVIVHSLGEKFVAVQVYDENDYLLLPQDVHLDSIDQVTISFATNQQGTAVIVT